MNSPKRHAQLLSQRPEHVLVRGVHVLLLERAVGGAVLEPVSDRLAVGGEVFAGLVAEVVEALAKVPAPPTSH